MKLTEKEIKAIESLFWQAREDGTLITQALFGSTVRRVISWAQGEGLLNVKACKLFSGIYHEDDAVKGVQYMQVDRALPYNVRQSTRGSNNG